MKYFLGAAALFAASVAADCTNDNNNWYCALVSAITYTGVGGSGSYNKVTSMDSDTGDCSSSPYGYSGSLAPLDEEVSMHFRGPLQLKQFAVYTPGQASQKRSAGVEKRHAHGNPHAHLHHERHVEERQVGDMVTVTMNGQVVSWTNEYSGAGSEATSAPEAPASYGAPSSVSSYAVTSATSAPDSYSAPPSESTPPTSSPTAAAGSISSSSGGWGRQAYYNSADGTADGLVFLNHYGAQGCSGTFDYKFGNSLSYATTNGQACSSTAQTLADTTLPSSAEVVVMTNQKCEGDDCGFYRDNTTAYHGFDGAQKAFFFEFQMPDEGGAAANEYDPVNMPAIWMLNAQIPRTLQYGNAGCSCWASGCGEFDIFEVLSPGSTKCKSTLHGNIAGGDSNYFDRPVNGPAKGALIMYNNNIHIKMWPSDTHELPSTMDADTINAILGSTSEQSNTVSLFNLAGAGSG